VKKKMAKALRLKDLRGYYCMKKDQEIMESMKMGGYEPFRLPSHSKEAGEIAFRKRRQSGVV
jgi:hypothetical protein